MSTVASYLTAMSATDPRYSPSLQGTRYRLSQTTPMMTSAQTTTFEYDVEAAQLDGRTLGPFGPVPKFKEVAPIRRRETVQGEFATANGAREYQEQGQRLNDQSVESTAVQPDSEGQNPNLKFGRTTIGWLLFIPVIFVILWVPAIIKISNAMLLNVNLFYWSAWLTIIWAGIWTVIVISYLTPRIFKSTSIVSPRYRAQHVYEVQRVHRYNGFLALSNVVWLSYQLLIVKNFPRSPDSVQEAAIINITSAFLLAIIICLFILFLQQRSIQRMSESFHERLYAKRILHQEAVVQALSVLYRHSVDIVVRLDARNSELVLGSNPNAALDNWKAYGEQMKGGDHGRAKSGIAGYSTLQGQSAEPLVKEALSTPKKSISLARRIFYSFSRPGGDVVVAQDVALFFPTRNDAASAFALFDRDGNGDISRAELEALCLEFHQEEMAIADSIRDTSDAFCQLNNIATSLGYVACAVIISVVLSAQIAFLIAGVGALLLSLAWLVGGSLQEVMTSIIFIFAKHPFDVGDEVVIKNETFTVKKIKLLSTVFLDANLTLVQVSNHFLNNQFIYNTRRSSNMSEKFVFSVHYSTSLQEVEKIREKMLEFVKSESRDFQPKFDVAIKNFPGQSSMTLSADINYKSHFVGLKVARRNKWLCALKSTLSDLNIQDPSGMPLTVGEYANVPSELVEENNGSLDRDQTVVALEVS